MALSALAALVSACTDSDSDTVERLQSDALITAQSAQRAQILAALEPLDPLRYHEHDGTIRNEGRIPAAAMIWATRARETLDWVDWPVELEEHAAQYGEWLDSLLAAMRDDDSEAASEPSKITHALAHTFEATLEAWLSNETLPAVPPLAGLEPPSHDDHGSHADDSDSSMSDDHDDHQERTHDDQQSSMQHDDHDDHGDQVEDQMQHEDDDADHGDHE